MKKCVKLIAGLLMAMVMMVTNVGSVMAASYSWDMNKNPGSSASTDIVTMPFYKGEIYFRVESISGTCPYYAAVCHSKYPNKYYVDNNTQSAMVSVSGATYGFYLEYTVWGILEQTVILETYIDHNGTTGDRISCYGTVYY